MFFSFKSKPVLSSLIPKGFIDIHSHFIPGIDDGAKNCSESEQLLLEMKAMGITQAIGTPHIFPGLWNNTKDSIKNAHEVLETHLYNKNLSTIPTKISAEYYIDPSLLEQIENNTILPIKDKYILIEMSYMNPPVALFDIIFKLKHKGYLPILAHPERYLFYHNSFNNYKKLKDAGCLFQLNLLSTVGYYGPSVTKTAQQLLQHNMIDFVGSDIHHMRHIKAFKKPVIIKNIKELELAFSRNSLFNF